MSSSLVHSPPVLGALVSVFGPWFLRWCHESRVNYGNFTVHSGLLRQFVLLISYCWLLLQRDGGREQRQHRQGVAGAKGPSGAGNCRRDHDCLQVANVLDDALAVAYNRDQLRLMHLLRHRGNSDGVHGDRVRNGTRGAVVARRGTRLQDASPHTKTTVVGVGEGELLSRSR